MKKRNVKSNSRTNVGATKTKKNYVLNILLIILCIVAVLFIVKLIFVNDTEKSPGTLLEEEIAIDDINPGDECSTSSQCGNQCTKACVQGNCKDTGKVLCDNGVCGNDIQDCVCNEECNPCTESCDTGTKQCLSNRNVECTVNGEKTGECASLASLCSGCDPACNSCQRCKTGTSGDKYCVNDENMVECPGTNYCVPSGQESTCPGECPTTCDFCIEKCITQSDGSKSCGQSINQICPQDGSCRDPNFNCESLSTDK